MIAEALGILCMWNPEWQPQHVMIDKSDAEQSAVEQTFGGSTAILLCDFHRLQAWWRWLNDGKHGMGTNARCECMRAGGSALHAPQPFACPPPIHAPTTQKQSTTTPHRAGRRPRLR